MAILGAVNTVFSNRIEALFDLLKHKLKEGSGIPFKKCLIVVPGQRVKGWLRQKIADDPELKTTLGIQIVPLEEALYTLKNYFLAPSKRTPSLFELACLIETKLPSLEIDDLSLKQWIGSGPKKRARLAQTLAVLFQKYGRFSPDSLSGWQKSLWDKLFSESSPWTYPYKALLEPELLDQPPFDIELFGFSFLSKLEHTFFSRLSEKTPITFYLLSPCLHFWSDVATDREKNYFLQNAPEKDLEKLDELLSDTNPLLANFGKMGREMAKQLEETPSEPYKAYVVSKETLNRGQYDLFEEAAYLVDEPPSVLRQLQTDLLLLRNPKAHDPIEVKESDDSIEIHKLPTKAREMEALKDLIFRLKEEGVDDILVMAPDIAPYEPYIEAYFEDIPHTLSDPSAPDLSPFLALLDFYDYLEPEELIPLFEGGDFDEEELEWLKKEALNSNFYETGIEDALHKMMGEKCEITRLETLDKASLFIQSLKKNTPPESAPLKAWAKWLEALPIKAPDEIVQECLKKGERVLEGVSYALLKNWIHTTLLRAKEKKGEAFLGGVRFSSMKPMRCVPAEAILLIGMRDGAYPRSELKDPLDQSDGDFAPTRGDFDRTVFLETLLSARSHLFILWSGTESPSRVVKELLSYLNVGFKGEFEAIEHPAWGHDPWYFQKKCPFKSYSRTGYNIAAGNIPPDSVPKAICKTAKRELLSLGDLKTLLSDPKKYYHKARGVKLPFEGRTSPKEPYELNGLENWQIKDNFLKNKPSKFDGDGLFSIHKNAQAEESLEKASEQLREYGVGSPTSRYFPPTVDLPLHGKIFGIVEDGLVIEGEKKEKKTLGALPELLRLQMEDPSKNTIYYLNKKHTKKINVDAQELLKRWIAYAHQAKEKPFPFLPEAIKPLLDRDLKGLEKALNDTDFDAKEVLESYHEEAERLFGPIREAL